MKIKPFQYQPNNNRAMPKIAADAEHFIQAVVKNKN